MQPTTDGSLTTGVVEAMQMILPALEEFLHFEDRDLAAIDYAGWRVALDEPLPRQGAGPRATLETLAKIVIPHGVRIGAPGFSGWVNTTPTIVPALAAFSAAQRSKLESHARLLPVSIPHIEHYGGGGIRCMLAEIHLPKRRMS